MNFVKTLAMVLLPMLLGHNLLAQFHTLRMPQPSNQVEETQRLAVTDITINYHSPAVRGRDVWTEVIPQNGDPIPWRAGANMNTTIEFSTDVEINGKALSAGIYGFHVIPRADRYTLLFAHNHNQWGSYYLNIAEDVSLQVDVQAETCAFSEKLDYEFLPIAEDSMTIALEWAERRLPFTVTIDLDETVVNSLRSELRGINTYHWQAWNDAAQWCLNHDTNLEEALAWAIRSVEGGYGGFAADRNITNMSTKARLQKRLGQKADLDDTVNEMTGMASTAYEANQLSRFLLELAYYQQAETVCAQALQEEPDTWFLQLNQGIANYFLGNQSTAVQLIEKSQSGAPERFHSRLKEIQEEVAAGSYQLPNG